jgi:hypothetical protein
MNWKEKGKRKKKLKSQLVIPTRTKRCCATSMPGSTFSPGWYYQLRLKGDIPGPENWD